MTKANTVHELLQVVDAIDTHAGRVKLKSGGYLRGELVVENADREEVAALSNRPGVYAYTEVDGPGAVDVVEQRLDRVRYSARAPRRPSTTEEAALWRASSANSITIPRKGAPV